MNAFRQQDERPIEILEIGRDSERRQVEKLDALRRRRDDGRVASALDSLRRAAGGNQNTMPQLLDAVRALATVGEICGALGDVFGAWQERTVL